MIFYEKTLWRPHQGCLLTSTYCTCYPLFFLVVHMSPAWWGLHNRFVSLESTYASPGPPKPEILFNFFSIRLLPYFTCCWEDSFGVKYIWRCLWGLEAYNYIKCLWVLLTNVYWLWATGGYICGCGRPSNLVYGLSVHLIKFDLRWPGQVESR